MAMKRFETNGDPNEFAGNNCFHLTTIDTDGNPITLTGIVKEMPSFGLSTEWVEAPRATFGKKVQEFFMSDLVNTATFLAGGVNTTQLLMDHWSSRMYNGSTNKDITLNFRIYPQNLLGQDDPKTWMKYLSKYATVSAAGVLNVGTLEQNIKDSLIAMKGEGGEIGEALSSLAAGTDGNAETDEMKKIRKTKISQITFKIVEFTNNAKATVKDKLLTTQAGIPIKVWSGSDDKRKSENVYIDAILDTCDLWIESGEKGTYESDVDLTDDTPFTYKFKWKDQDYTFKSTSTEHVTDKTLDTTTCTLDVESIMGALSSDGGWDNNVWGKDQVENYFRSVLENVNEQIKAAKLDFNANYQTLMSAGSETLKKIENSLASQFATEDRWKVKFLSSNLWQLDIFRFIFKQPIIVAITDWKVTPSLEMMDGFHAYYDFSITCRPDQVKSLQRWKQVIKYEAQQPTIQ